jgi:hypothetical protein
VLYIAFLFAASAAFAGPAGNFERAGISGFLLSIPTTAKMALRTSGDAYVTAGRSGEAHMTADRKAIGTSEVFELIDRDGGTLRSGDAVHLRASNGQYVVVEDGGDAGVSVNGATTGAWETFIIVKVGPGDTITPGDAVAFRTSGGRYLTVEGDGGAHVTARGVAIGAWETFRYMTPC